MMSQSPAMMLGSAAMCCVAFALSEKVLCSNFGEYNDECKTVSKFSMPSALVLGLMAMCCCLMPMMGMGGMGGMGGGGYGGMY